VPNVPSAGDARDRHRKEDRSRRPQRPVEPPPAEDGDRPGDDGSPAPDTEEHRVDIVV
jgi:hypothetical protein